MSDEKPSSSDSPLSDSSAKRFSESIVIACLWLILLAGVFLSILAARSHVVSWVLIFGSILFFRVHFPISSWNDQHWVQWYGATAVLTGHNPFTAAELTQVSWANYFPTGSLFGTLWLVLGIHAYWIPWHVLNLCLFSIPFVLNPSLRNLVVFIVLTEYFPLSDYTGGGGTLEIGYALLIGGIYLLKSKHTIPAVIILAYGCLFRQPQIFVFAFVAIILWQRSNRRALLLYALLTLLFGGLFALTSPGDFFDATVRCFDAFAQLWYNQNGGLRANYSISTVLLNFGVPESTAWIGLKPFYMPVMLLGMVAMLLVAWRKRRDEAWVIGTMLLSIPWVYFMSRGFVMYHYLVAACFPCAVLFTDYRSLPDRHPKFATYYSNGLAVVILIIGLTPLTLWLGARVGNLFAASLDEYSFRPVAITVGIDAQILNANQSVRAKLNDSVIFQFPEAVTAKVLRINGRKSGPIVLHNVAFKAWPPDGVVTRVLTQGELWASEDGQDYWLLRRFRNSIDYNVYPLEINLGSTRPFRFLKIIGRKAVGVNGEYEFQDIRLLTRLPR